MIIIRQSTARTIPIGPFVDSTDGVTPETGISASLTQAEVRLSKNGGAFAQKSGAAALSHLEEGWYALDVSTTDSDTVGELTVAIYVAGALPVWLKLQVIEEAVYDALFAAAATGALPVSSGGIASTAFAAGAINAAAIAADAIGASELAADAATEIAAAVAATALTDSVPADGALPTVAQSLYMIGQFLMERAVSGTTVTVKKVNGSTTLMTFTLSDATNPTSITRST